MKKEREKSTMETVTRVVFFVAPKKDGRTVYYFGSISAIFDKFTAEEIGCKLETLWKSHITPGHTHIGRKCIISKEPVQRKKQKNHEK